MGEDGGSSEAESKSNKRRRKIIIKKDSLLIDDLISKNLTRDRIRGEHLLQTLKEELKQSELDKDQQAKKKIGVKLNAE
jgi:hypothetical protein